MVVAVVVVVVVVADLRPGMRCASRFESLP